MSDGKVVFEIKGDPKGINTTLKDVTANIEKESKKWDDAAEQSTGNIEKGFSGMLKGIVGTISAAGIAKLILDWGKAAVSAASDLAEVQNVVDVTFGDSARQIQTWSEAAGKQYGLTETQAKRYASTIGAMLKSQGVAHEQMLSMSKDLAGLAADMASFYNLDFDTAFEKIRAGISGETMPLKQLGINMSVANLEAFALSQGIEKSYSAMSQGEQTMLRYQYLMKATADAQGDFARTSDGFANATRRVEASLETIKTKGGALLMQVVEPLTNDIAYLLEILSQADDKTALGLFADIDKEYAGKYAAVEATYNKASNLIEIIDELQKKTASLSNGSQISFEKLFGDIGKVEKNGGDVRAYLQGIGADVDFVMQKYNVWKDAIGQVTSAIPSLSAVIDEETGAIIGSTSAIQANVDEWKRGEEKKLAWKAYYAKASAVEERKAAMYEYELDYKLAVKAGQEYRKELVTKYGEEAVSILENLYANAPGYDFFYGVLGWIDSDMASKFGGDKDAIKKYVELINSGKAAKAKYKSQTEDLTSAEKELADAYNILIGKYGEGTDVINDADDAWVDYGKKSKDAWQTSSEAAKTALQALADYAQGVHDATAQTVDGIVKGFAVLERPTTALEEKRSKLIEQQNELNRSTRDGAKRYEELQAQIDDLNKSLDAYSPKGMQDALQSQLAFMDEYIKNLEKAQQMGLSNDLLASLSDGSVQSAEYLASLVASPAQAAEVDALFQQVQAKKNEFTNALTEQKLTVDETYQGMVETAKAAIDDMRMGADASEATAETVQGMIDGLKSKMPALSDEIDAILAELNRLNGFGISIDLSHTSAGASAFGERFFGDRNIPAHETGLDYVPFDGYLASLHEGESILTAEENRIWQRFKNGSAPQSMDYDALGATMRENVQAGGNVYLDGKTVGRVISDQQGNSYRQLQRSGWQA